jgi:hypothetical protein
MDFYTMQCPWAEVFPKQWALGLQPEGPIILGAT